MPDPLISVIIACYNGAAFLESAVGGALANHPAAEVIVVDDGSTDDSLARAAALARQFPGRMWVASQANGGPAGARNTGIRLASGKYLCFLDVDDQQAPGFLDAAAGVLDRDPSAVAVSCQIELINAHRPVETWQREAMEMSGPCNVVMRTEIARQIGGFPVDPAFRGQAGGEDLCFRQALLRFGKVPKIEHPFFRYRMRPGGYVDLFLDRAVLVDGRVQMKYPTPQEKDGSFYQATARYEVEVTLRGLAKLADRLEASISGAADFYQHAGRFASIPGSVHPLECHVLHWIARNWPLDGGIVDIGGSDARALSVLAAASLEARRANVTAIGIADSLLPEINEGLKLGGAANAVQFRAGPPEQAAIAWEGRVRILFVSGQYPADQLAAIVRAWMSRVTRFGLVVFQGASSRPPVVASIAQLRSETSSWKELIRVHDLAMFQKL